MILLMVRICIVAVKDYHDGERHEFDQLLKDVPHGRLRFAITVGNCSKGTQPFEETRTSGGGSEVCISDLEYKE